MRIFLTLFEPKEKTPEKMEFNGNWSLELMINTLLKKYYGKVIAEKVDDLLRERIK